MVRVGVVDQGYGKTGDYTACLAAVGVAFEVLTWDPDRAEADAARFSALVLCGGDDVAARHFGQDDHPAVTLDFEARDLYELALCRRAVELEVPFLGICRGAQVLNVALGGDLEQHVPDVPGRGAHADGALHGLELAAGSALAALAGAGGDPDVNSFHHQAIGYVAGELRVVARSPDGVIEAVEGPGRFCLGVQWHPERAGNADPFGASLFRALVRAASVAAA